MTLYFLSFYIDNVIEVERIQPSHPPVKRLREERNGVEEEEDRRKKKKRKRT